jgi:type VI secretion system protein
MRRRLLERVLDGPGSRGLGGESFDTIKDSVVDSLRRIFGTVHDDASTDAGFGLPDVGGLSRSMPHATEQMREAIVAAIERYEPRLCNVKVLPVPDPQGRILRFDIVARMKTDEGGAGPAFKAATRLQTSGHLVVEE